MGLPKDIHAGAFFGRPITSAVLSRAYMCVMLSGFVGGLGSHVYFDKQRRFSLFIVISIQVFPAVRGCRDSKRPRHGRNDCLRKRAGEGMFSSVLSVNKMTSKARAAIRWACDQRRLRWNRHDPLMGEP